MSREDERSFGTADFARVGESPRATDDLAPQVQRTDALDDPAQQMQRTAAMDDQTPKQATRSEPLAALFQGEKADEFRQRWDAIQIGFVDDPRDAVRQADELVAQVLRSLAEGFADQRSQIEAGIGEGGESKTEDMRIALQRYRSFFQRLLSL
jgi:hypothetical protein